MLQDRSSRSQLTVTRNEAGPVLPALVAGAGDRRALGAGIETAIGCHTFRATGTTDYPANGGHIEVAQRMAGHSNAKTTGLCGRRNDDVSVGKADRIGI
jgi:integrase